MQITANTCIVTSLMYLVVQFEARHSAKRRGGRMRLGGSRRTAAPRNDIAVSNERVYRLLHIALESCGVLRGSLGARAGRSGRTQPAMEIPSNFNADFHSHRKESQALVKSKQGRGAGPHDPNLASDGKAAAQFRKNERNKR